MIAQDTSQIMDTQGDMVVLIGKGRNLAIENDFDLILR